MRWRYATVADVELLADLNEQLIADEGHSNSMNKKQLAERMGGWLRDEYTAVIFESELDVVAYALFRADERERIHLRQFFVARAFRRRGVGRQAVALLRHDVLVGCSLILDVLITNAAGRAFWKACGFCEYAVTLLAAPQTSSAQ